MNIKIKRIFGPLLLTVILFVFTIQTHAKPIHHAKHVAAKQKWTGTWGTARQLIEPNNMPPAPGLSNNTLRQVVCVSVGGKNIRLKLSNEFGNAPLTIKAVQVAAIKGGAAIDASTTKYLKFGGRAGITLQPGTELYADAVAFNLQPRMQLAITIAFGDVPTALTGHPGSRTTSYLLTGEQTDATTDFTNAVKTDHWYVITGIDVQTTDSAGSVVVLGDSITDGRGSGTNQQNRWPDILAINLLQHTATRNIGVLNMGIGGNAVLKGGLGPTAVNRFEHDVLMQSGVKWLIIFEGVNDLGGTRDSIAAVDAAKGIIAAYDKMITEAHAKHIKVYGATITPFKGSSYYRSYRDVARNMINEWIRNSGRFDAIIDFDKIMRDPADTAALLDATQSGANDHLHPNELGYKMMGDAVDPGLFK